MPIVSSLPNGQKTVSWNGITGKPDLYTKSEINNMINQISTENVMVPASAWTGSSAPYTAVVAVPNLEPFDRITVQSQPSLTVEEFKAISAAAIVCTAMTTGEITLVAYGDARPSIDLPVQVIVEKEMMSFSPKHLEGMVESGKKLQCSYSFDGITEAATFIAVVYLIGTGTTAISYPPYHQYVMLGTVFGYGADAPNNTSSFTFDHAPATNKNYIFNRKDLGGFTFTLEVLQGPAPSISIID